MLVSFTIASKLRICTQHRARTAWALRSAMARPVLFALAALCCCCSAFLTAVSTIKECINDGSGDLRAKNGSTCGKRLIVAMTVEANEVIKIIKYSIKFLMFIQGKSQYLEANIRKVQDSTTNKKVQLKKPLRIRITKSPVLINYRLYQVGVRKAVNWYCVS